MSDDGNTQARPGISRRRFLAYTGASGTLFLLHDLHTLEALAKSGAIVNPGPVTMTRIARRREDFLSLTFEFRNLRLGPMKKRLVKKSVNQPAFLVVVFPPQHVSDETDQLADLRVPGEVRSRLAQPTRLAFEVPASILPLAFDLQTLLDWTQLDQRVVPAAGLAAPPPSLEEPASHQTAIELPWRLVLSPRPDAGWAHAAAPVTHGPRTELWHTRLGTRTASGVDEFDPAKRTVRAVWARDPGFSPTKKPSSPPNEDPQFSLTALDRWEIVGLTSRVAQRRPVQVDRLMLSALGGWLDSRGEWDPPAGFSVEEWRHRVAMGRDSYVRLVESGFLLPFGHKAAKVTISERQLHTRPGGHPRGAYLVLRQYIVVRQPLKEYGSAKAPFQPADGRAFPFRSVRINTLTTPDLKANDAPSYFPVTEVGQQDVLFDLVGTDWEGQASEFMAPLLWVEKNAAYNDPNALANLAGQYNSTSTGRRRRPVHGQKVAFAPAKEGGETSFSVGELLFRAQELVGDTEQELQNRLNQLNELGESPFFPLLSEATVRLSAVAETAVDALQDLVPVQIDPGFITNGIPGFDFDDIDEALSLAQNPGELFLKVVEGALPDLSFGSTDAAGGIAAPNLSIAALSRALGPVGGVLDNLRKGKFDPKTFFDPAAKLLGSLKLGDILKVVEGPNGLGENGPTLQNIIVPKPPAVPQKVITRLDWAPELANFDPLQIFEADGNSSLTLKAEATTDLVNPDASTFSVEGLLRNVKLNLIGDNAFLIIEVKQVKFTAGKDKPPDLDPQLGEITFDGPLAFVEELRNFLSSLGKGFGIEVQPTGIEASLVLPLPTISVGVFTLQNISIGLGASVPFTGDAARFRFSFCSRENPFILTVAMFGGGGFFAIECGTDKSLMLELALEFGAAVAFDIGVASGGAEIMAGIYIKVENDNALLSGYLRAAGELSILGLIRISCEIYLGFEYHSETDKCIGRASFYLEIEIFGFITIPVSAEVERKFGGENDPTFAQLMSPSDWTEYCTAYAPLGAP